jgi:hypothetical protein
MHVALGMEYRERKVVQGPVVYLVLEGEVGYGARVAAFKQRHRLDDDKPIPLYDVTQRVDLVADHKTLIKDISAQLIDQSPVLVVVDTLNRSLRGSENKDEDMSAYVKAADAIREAFQCAVLIVHHCGTSGERPRGHTSLTGAADAQIAVRRDSERNVVCRIEYMKDGQEGDQIISRLPRVVVGREIDGTEISSCVIEAVGGRVGDKGWRPNDLERLFMTCLFECLDEHGVATKDAGLDLPRSVHKAVEWKYVATKMREKTFSAEEDEGKHENRVRKQLQRCGEKLGGGQVIGVLRSKTKEGKSWIWWTGKPVVGMASTQPKTFEQQPEQAPGIESHQGDLDETWK